MCTRDRERGYSLLELLVVLGIVGIMLAISIPNIFEWLKLYRLRAAAQEVTGELQSARLQAIMKNARFGVTLFIVDSNSYRWVNLDLAKSPDPLLVAQAIGPLRDLPQDVVFDQPSQTTPLPGGVATDGLHFNRLGAVCAQGVDQDCDVEIPICPESRCNDNTSTAVRMVSNGNGVSQVGLLNQRNGLTRALTVTLGGRVEGQ